MNDLCLGRRNRGKQKDTSHHHHNHNHNHNQNNFQHQQSQHHHPQPNNQPTSKDNQNSLSVIRNRSPLPPSPSEPCELCARSDLEIKKLRSDISHLKQSENELRQKSEQSSVMKSCLQAKQKENDELERRYVHIVVGHGLMCTVHEY